MELEIIEPTNENVSPGKCHYILHHPVIREDKNTSKVRIVFDASAKSDGPSLNKCLYKDPQLTPLVFDILIRFRSFAIALTSDIEKAFLQININENERDYLRFPWFDNVFSDSPKVVRNRFARVIFGVTSSPFLLNQTIRKHVQSYEFDIDFVNIVLNSLYVDDFTGGENDFDKALDLYKKLKIRFLERLFHLRKWRTNHPKLRKLIGEQSLGPSKSLEVIWDEQTDNFIFDFAEIYKFSKGLNVTKRNVSSVFWTDFGQIYKFQVKKELSFPFIPVFENL